MMITEEGAIAIRLTGMDRGLLEDRDQRQLLIWMRNNRLEMVREILCDGCPEVQ